MHDYAIIAILILTVISLAAIIMALTHLIGPKRHGPIKDMTYEAGVDPIGDARQRFNVRFYLVAVLFLVFDVEIIFMYPWAVLFRRFNDPSHQAWATSLAAEGFDLAFVSVSMLIFFLLLLVGFVYEWRKGIFRWD